SPEKALFKTMNIISLFVSAGLEELTPRCEIYSIDEALCDVSGVRHCRDLTDFGREIRASALVPDYGLLMAWRVVLLALA
ncbi:hypothetical protein Q6297_29745, partial [Klebsiella pneumoniae]|nr:hypothetical protein [Klebsiella pneumoniae]